MTNVPQSDLREHQLKRCQKKHAAAIINYLVPIVLRSKNLRIFLRLFQNFDRLFSYQVLIIFNLPG